MKTLLTTIIFLGFYLTSTAQIDFENPPWQTGCDSLETQSEMNICSYEKFKIADSILNSYYDKLIENVDSQYTAELKEYPDTTNNVEKDYLRKLKEQKQSIIKSREDFKTFLKSTIDIIEYQYWGGTMMPMAVNIYALDLTVNQIKILINLMDEIIEKN